jgi:hypothetical protein
LLSTHGAVIAGLTHLLTTNNFQDQDALDFLPPSSLRIIKNNQIVFEKTF